MDLWYVVLFGIATIFILLNLWWLKIGRKKARLDLDWVADCERAPYFTIHDDGDTFTLHDRRDFTWHTTKDYDVKWDEWTAKISDLVGVWYVIDHFHSLRVLSSQKIDSLRHHLRLDAR